MEVCVGRDEDVGGGVHGAADGVAGVDEVCVARGGRQRRLGRRGRGRERVLVVGHGRGGGRAVRGPHGGRVGARREGGRGRAGKDDGDGDGDDDGEEGEAVVVVMVDRAGGKARRPMRPRCEMWLCPIESSPRTPTHHTPQARRRAPHTAPAPPAPSLSRTAHVTTLSVTRHTSCVNACVARPQLLPHRLDTRQP